MTDTCTNTATTVDALIGAAVHRWGDSESVRAFGKSVSYRDLDAACGRLAAELSSRGVKPETVVGLCLSRGLEQLIGLAGILRAGAAVLPLDPGYPRDLLAYMLADSAATIVVTDDPTDEALPQGGTERLQIAKINSAPGAGMPPERDRAAALGSSNSTSADTGAESLCYVLYTSGSTGRPKAVAMPHRALMNLLTWQRAVMPLNQGARVLQFASPSFDVSFQEIFSTWAEGGTLVLVDDDTRRDPRALWRVIAEENVQRVFLPYVALQALAEQAPADLPGGLRDVITAGEQLRITPQIRSLFSRMKGVRLHNHYGPTETHVCTAHTLIGSPGEWPLLPPIGKPIAKTEVVLLDEHQQPGSEGELYVGGACLAAGYFRRADLTAERFATVDGRRFYRTGDLARRGADGALEYLGRVDDQLKVRGFRIEPGEIEAQLSQHPAVRECAVTARDQRLLAYWVGEDVEAHALRSFLSARLAPHLVPASYTRLDVMPLTASGKINRRALPDAHTATGTVLTGKPLSEMESRIARIWAEVLRVRSIPPDINFGDLGGTSLHAAEAQAKLADELKRELPATQLYEFPTVIALARALERNAAAEPLRERTQSRAAAQRRAMNQRARAGRRKPQRIAQ